MKKNYLLSVLITMFSFGANAQEHLSLSKMPVCSLSKNFYKSRYTMSPAFENADKVEKEFYLQRSRNQKTAAWILLGGGTLLIGGAYLFGNNSDASFDAAATSVVVAGVGVLTCFGSIPLFIASKKNKAKTMLTFRIQRPSSLVSKHIPVFGVRIPLS